MGTLSHHLDKADEFLNRADQVISNHYPLILNCRRSACAGPPAHHKRAEGRATHPTKSNHPLNPAAGSHLADAPMQNPSPSHATESD